MNPVCDDSTVSSLGRRSSPSVSSTNVIWSCYPLVASISFPACSIHSHGGLTYQRSSHDQKSIIEHVQALRKAWAGLGTRLDRNAAGNITATIRGRSKGTLEEIHLVPSSGRPVIPALEARVVVMEQCGNDNVYIHRINSPSGFPGRSSIAPVW
jgi:hypothetical protein